MTRFLKHHLFWLLLILAVIGIPIGLVVWQKGLLYDTLFHLENARQQGEVLRAAIRDHRLLAPLLFITLQVLQVVIAPIPGEASGVLGGYLFGGWVSFAYSTIGLTLGSWLAFAIGRLLSDMVRRRLEQAKIYQQFNHLVAKGDFVIPFVLFLLPGFPKDALSYLLGLSHMPLPVFLFITAIGRMPGTLLLSFQGAELQSGNYLRLAILLLITAAIAVPSYLYRHRILRRISKSPAKGGDGADFCQVNQDE